MHKPGSFGYRPKKTAHAAIQVVSGAILQRKTYVIDLDLRAYFDTVRHDLLLRKVSERVQDDAVMRLLRMILKTSGRIGVPQGGVISPLLSNLYLNEVDRMLERAKAVTREGPWLRVEYARFADDLVILVDAHPRWQWLRAGIQRRLREELAKIQVEVNDEKTRVVDLSKGESFGFLGFEFRRVRSRRGKWMPLRLPQTKRRTALLRQLKEQFRRARSQPTVGLIEQINLTLRGWVAYFAVGHSSRCFSFVRNWVEMKVRRHLARARMRHGFGWKRWSRQWLYRSLGLFDGYRVRWLPPAAAPAR